MWPERQKNIRLDSYLCHFSDRSDAVQSFHYSVIVLLLHDKGKSILHLQAFASYISLEKNIISIHVFSIKASVKATMAHKRNLR